VADGLILRGGTVLTGAGWRPQCDVRVAGEHIAAVGPDLVGDGAEVLDATGHWVVPGLIDVHVHGAGGAMFEDGRAESVERICAVLAGFGTTGIVATVAALPRDRLQAAVAAIAQAAPRVGGARILGIHLEGPFLNPRRAGAQSRESMRLPSLDEIEALQRASGGMVRMITVAPELPGALDCIAALHGRGIAVALGHTEASEEQTLQAIAAGARHITHLFNAAPPLHHREPGVVGTALTDDRLSVELICDGEHLHRRAIDVALRCKPPDQIVLASDGVAAIGLPDGELELFGTPCVARAAVRVKTTGQLAGSRLTLDRAVRNLRGWFPALPLERLLAWATATPAALIGLADRVGQIGPGHRADLVVLDRELALVACVCAGRVATG